MLSWLKHLFRMRRYYKHRTKRWVRCENCDAWFPRYYGLVRLYPVERFKATPHRFYKVPGQAVYVLRCGHCPIDVVHTVGGAYMDAYRPDRPLPKAIVAHVKRLGD